MLLLARDQKFIFTKMNKGITLIETVLYLALFSLLIIGFLPQFSYFNTWQGNIRLGLQNEQDFLSTQAQIRSRLLNNEPLSSIKTDEILHSNFDENSRGNFELLDFSVVDLKSNFGTTSIPIANE